MSGKIPANTRLARVESSAIKAVRRSSLISSARNTADRRVPAWASPTQNTNKLIGVPQKVRESSIHDDGPSYSE